MEKQIWYKFNKIMKQLIRSAAIILSIYTAGGSTCAQSLHTLLAKADTSNLELKAFYQEYLAAREVAPQVSQLPEPEAGLGVFPLPVETRLGPQWVRLSITQTLPWKGTLAARKDVALSRADAQYENIAATRLQIQYQIKTAYYQLYELQQRQSILQKSIDIFKMLESVATTKVSTGKASLADVLRIRIRTHDLEQQLTLIENQKRKPVAAINELLDRSPDAPVQIIDTLALALPVINPDTLLSRIRESHPMLQMYTLQQKTSQDAIQLNALEGKPSFAVGIDYINVGNRTDAAPAHNGRDILSPRVGVRIPLYRDKYRAKEQEEKMRIDALETRKAELLLRFRSAIEAASSDLEDGRIKYQLYRDQKATTQSAIDLLMSEYSTKGASFIDLLQMENQLVDYDLKTLDALVQTNTARAEIERYIPE